MLARVNILSNSISEYYYKIFIWLNNHNINISEGQRKALFEEAERQQKNNFEEIINLKKEISRISVLLYQNKSTVVKYRLGNIHIEHCIGSIGDRSCSEVEIFLDLQIIDRKKQADLLMFNTKQVRHENIVYVFCWDFLSFLIRSTLYCKKL